MACPLSHSLPKTCRHFLIPLFFWWCVFPYFCFFHCPGYSVEPFNLEAHTVHFWKILLNHLIDSFFLYFLSSLWNFYLNITLHSGKFPKIICETFYWAFTFCYRILISECFLIFWIFLFSIASNYLIFLSSAFYCNFTWWLYLRFNLSFSILYLLSSV